MKNLKNPLNNIYEKHALEYKNCFDNSAGLASMANNLENFSSILEKLIDELTDESNKFVNENDEKFKSTAIEYIKELILKYRNLMLNPFD